MTERTDHPSLPDGYKVDTIPGKACFRVWRTILVPIDGVAFDTPSEAASFAWGYETRRKEEGND